MYMGVFGGYGLCPGTHYQKIGGYAEGKGIIPLVTILCICSLVSYRMGTC